MIFCSRDIHQENGKHHWLVLVPDEPINLAGETEFVLQLHCNEQEREQHTLGRFRVSVTTDEKTVDAATLRCLFERSKRHASHVRANGWARLAVAFAVCGQPVRAIEAIHKSYEIKQQYPDRSKLTTALAYAHMNNRTRADEILTRIGNPLLHDNLHEREWYFRIHAMIPGVFLAKDSNDANLLSHQALAYWRNGNTAEAAEVYERLYKTGILPPNDYEAGDYADYLLTKTTAWQPLTPTNMSSEKSATFTALKDQSVLVSGNSEDNDVYTITAKTDAKTFRYLRLEALPHITLPNGGPGRGGNGNFHLSWLNVTAKSASSDKEVTLELLDATTDQHEGNQNGPDRATKDNTNNWSIWRKIGKPRWCMFRLKDLHDVAPDSEFTITMKFNTTAPRHSLGRFRLSVTAEPQAYRRQLYRSPRVNAWAKLGLAYALSGQRNLSLKALGKIESADEIGRSEHITLAQAYALNGDKAKAAVWLRKSLVALREGKMPAIWNRHTVYERMRAACDYAIEKGIDEVFARHCRGMVLEELRHKDLAKWDYQRLAELEPNNAEWRDRLTQFEPDVLTVWNFNFAVRAWSKPKSWKFSNENGVWKIEADKKAGTNFTISAPKGWQKVILRMKCKEADLFGVRWVEGPYQFRPMPDTSDDTWHKVEFFIENPEGDNTRLQIIARATVEIDSIVMRQVEGGLDDILTQLNKQLADNPNDVSTRLTRSTLLFTQQKWKEVLPDLDLLVKTYPKNVDLLRQRGITHRELRHDKEALADFNEVVKLNPEDPESWYQRADVLQYRFRKYEEAIADYYQAIRITEPSGNVYWYHFRLSECYSRLNSRKEALAHINKAMDLAPEHKTAYTIGHRGRIYAYQGKWKEAADDFHSALRDIKANNHYVNGWTWEAMALVFAYMEDNNYEYVRSEIVQRFPKFKDRYLVNRGLIRNCSLLPFDKKQQAILLEQEKRIKAYANSAALAYYRAGDFQEAEKRVGNRDQAFSLFLRALIQNKLRNRPQAEKLLEQANEKMKTDPPKIDADTWHEYLFAAILQREAIRELSESK